MPYLYIHSISNVRFQPIFLSYLLNPLTTVFSKSTFWRYNLYSCETYFKVHFDKFELHIPMQLT